MARAFKGFAGVSDAIGAHMDVDDLRDVMAEGDGLVANTGFSDLELVWEDAGAATFDTVAFRGCLFEGIDLTGCTMDRTWLNRVDFADCSAPGLSLLQARLSSVSMTSSDLSYANLSETSIDRLRADRTRFTEAALQRARLKRVEFDGCDLTRLDVFGTPLAGIDVSSCDFAAPVLSADFRELRGCTVSPEQALALAELLGVHIAEG